MPNLEVVPSTAIIGSDAGKGPKYNEDVITLEEGSEEQEEQEEQEETPLTEAEDEESEEQETPPEEEETEQEQEIVIPFDRPTVKEIKTKYPNIFKDFPQLKDMYFRELGFTKLYPTIEDAKEAFDDNEAFSTLSESVLSGDIAPLFDSVEKTDTKAFELMSLSFLPTLFKKSQDLYSQAVTPIMQNLVRQLYGDRDENTRNAALVLADYLFGSDGESVAKGQKSVAKSIVPTEEQQRLKAEKEQASSTAFRGSAGRVQETITKSLEQLVLKNVNFDPNKVFSPFLRRQGAQEISKRVMDHLKSDQGHMNVMASRWKRARTNGYTSDDESKIVSTYLARAKSLLPDACSKVSAAMLGTKVKAAKSKQDLTQTHRSENFSGRAVSNGKQRDRVNYATMSDIDILNS